MKHELSIFVDESGDFGVYQKICPFYIVCFVLHDQSINVENSIRKFRNTLIYFNLPNNYIHAGPIIRQEGNYYGLNLETRRKTIQATINLLRTTPIRYHCLIVDKSIARNELQLVTNLSFQIKEFVHNYFMFFSNFNVIKVYYDNGQKQLAKILASILPITLPCKVIFKNVNKPEKYYFLQVADTICTLELINKKMI